MPELSDNTILIRQIGRKNGKIQVDRGHHRLKAIQKGGDTMPELRQAAAIRKFFSTDCCNTSRLYPSVSVPEIKELKDACSPMEYSDLGQAAIEHLKSHKD